MKVIITLVMARGSCSSSRTSRVATTRKGTQAETSEKPDVSYKTYE